MKLLFLLCTAFFCSINFSNAQWSNHLLPGIPVQTSTQVSFVCSDTQSDTTVIFTFDTSYHFYTFTPQSGFSAYPQYDTMLDAAGQIQDAKIRNGVLWCTTTFGLKKWEHGTWTHYPYPAKYQNQFSGLCIDKEGRVWFSGGRLGVGISVFDGTDWFNIEKTIYPEFLQDAGVIDLEMDDQRQLLWIGTNCFTQQSGIYIYDLRMDNITYVQNGNPKYGCIHAVQPSGNKVFVGTSNFSSIRILENSVYTQNLDAPKVKWVSDMVADPYDSNRVWVLNEYGVTLFKDTNTYHYFDTTETSMKGMMNRMSIQKLGTDSALLWIGTSSGLYSYRYKKSSGNVSTPEIKGNTSPLVAYPNPSHGLIHLTAPQLTISGIKIFNILGEQVFIPLKEEKEHISLDVSLQPDGIYFLHIVTPAFSEVKRIEVRH